MHKIFIVFILLKAFTFGAFAQDTLPKISVKKIGNQIIVSWKNNYGAKISNINIQRSRDSLKNFTTIGSVLNPLNKENGFVDPKPSPVNFFYRVFVAFEGGTYIFSLSHHPVIETARAVEKVINNTTSFFTDSIITTTAPAPVPATAPPVIAEEPPVPEIKEGFLPHIKLPKVVLSVGFVPSKFIYTNKENNLIISLPDAEKLKYSIQFFDDMDRKVLEVKKITDNYFLMEKVNFLHSGWFYYELYEDGIFLEKYKFYIGKDGHFGPPPPENKKQSTIPHKEIMPLKKP